MTRISGEERRRDLIALAVELFGARGFEGTSLDAVAESAGVRKQTLLYYFPGKNELFDACVDELAARLGATLERALEGEDERERPERVISAIFRLAEEWPEFPPFAREASRRGPEVITRVTGALEPLRKRALVHLERGMNDGTFRRQDPTLLLFTLYTAVVGSLTEAGVLRALGGGQSSRSALKRREAELIQFVRRALEP
ncbi:MAG TPA: TetR/AcrR family transcriptional regulator [Actinomycetota bacterium]|nr:TetR/AcrR family transcriptional regulator [Actinomycetota bacterium]